MRDEVALAWAAGLFEGEGCFGVYPRESGVQVIAKLATTDRDVLERFRDVVGCGHIHRPKFDRRPNRKPLHTWVVYEATAVAELAEAFLPWLGERRSGKAREVIEAARTMRVASGQRTHCPQGHPYAGANLGLSNERRAQGPTRYCKACRRAYKRRVRAAA